MPADQNSVRLFSRWENAAMVGTGGTVWVGGRGDMGGEELSVYKNTEQDAVKIGLDW